jgi:hypothetical protein
MEVDDPLATAIITLCDQLFGIRPSPSTSISDSELRAVEQELGVSLPRSYQVFLRYFGSENPFSHDLFGLPRDRLWGDIVLMNELEPLCPPRGLVKFTEDDFGHAYFLDTSRMDAEGECPVVRRGPDDRETTVADNFLDFLRKVYSGRI